MEMSNTAEDVVDRYVRAYNERDLETLAGLFTDPFQFNGEDLGVDDFLGLVQGYWDAFPDLELEATHQVVDGEYVFDRHVFDATGVGEYYGHDVDGEAVSSAEMMLFHVTDGVIDEYWYEWSELDFWIQLGIVQDPYA